MPKRTKKKKEKNGFIFGSLLKRITAKKKLWTTKTKKRRRKERIPKYFGNFWQMGKWKGIDGSAVAQKNSP